MPCLDASQLELLLQGALPEPEASQARAHLATCATCAAAGEAAARMTGSSTGTLEVPSRVSPGSKRFAQPPLPRGTQVGRYLLLDRVGVGGMGQVYAAVDPELGRKVAIKLMSAESDGAESASGGQGRLLREAQAMARLTHPAVVQVYDVGTHGGGVFLAMQLVEGTTLIGWLAAAPRYPRDVLSVFLEAGREVAAAHAAGLIHRDFKPDNVLVGADGQVRVTDFGIARVARESAEPIAAAARPAVAEDGLTHEGATVGTLGFMSPEQMEGKSVDPRTDQFAFCVSLYRALYRQPPFKGTGVELLKAVLSGAVQPPPDGRVSPWVRSIILRGLSVDPSRRFPDMNALLEALRRDPAAERRQLLLRAAGLAALGLGAAYLGYLDGGRQVCGSARPRLQEVWSEPVSAGLARTFEATGKPYAKDVARTVQRELDRYGEAWVSGHAEACEATRVRGVQSDEVLALRTACLDDRLRELRALVELLSTADGELVRKAVQAVSALDDPEGCADVAALSSPTRLPADPAKAAQVQALKGRLAGPRALLLAGRFKEGAAQLRALEAEAVGLSHLPLLAEVRLLWGELLRDAGQLEEAEQRLLDAYADAEQSRHDEVRARAATALTSVVGLKLGRPADGARWGRLAQAVVARIGEPDDVAGALWSTLGNLEDQQGHYAEAVQAYERSLQARKRAFGPSGYQVGFTLNNLGLTLLNLGALGRARQALEQALDVETQALGRKHPLIASPLMNLASVEVKEGRSERAVSLNREAYEVALSSLGPEHPTTGLALGNLAEAYLPMKRYADALGAARAALDIYDARFAQGHPTTVYLLASMGEALLGLDRPAEARPVLERALALAESLALPPELSARVRTHLARAATLQPNVTSATRR